MSARGEKTVERTQASRRSQTVMIDLAQLERIKKGSRTKVKRGLTEWYNYGTPTAVITRDHHDIVRRLVLHLPFDVPAKPRTTQNSTWQPSYQNYLNWRGHFRKWVLNALGEAGYEGTEGEGLSLEGREVFAPALELCPLPKLARMAYVPPILVTGLARTKLRGDADNRVKSILDASNMLLWPDDRRVAGGLITVLPTDTGDPYMDITVQIVTGHDRGKKIAAFQKKVDDLAKDLALGCL